MPIAEARQIIHDPELTHSARKVLAAATLVECCEDQDVLIEDMLRCLDYGGTIATLGARALYVRTGRDGLGWTSASGHPFSFSRVDWEEYLWDHNLLPRQPVEIAEIIGEKPLSGATDERAFGSARGNTLWVKFTSQTDASEWIGKFGCGVYSTMRVTKVARPDKFLISAGGFAYVVDATRRVLLNQYLDEFSQDIVYHPFTNFFIVADYVRIRLIDHGKVHWASPRIALDGIRNLTMEGNIVRGFAVTGHNGEEEPFSLDLATRKVTCATDFSSWDNPPPQTTTPSKIKKPWWKCW